MGGSDYPNPRPGPGDLFARLASRQANEATTPAAQNSTIQGAAQKILNANGQTTISEGTYTFTTGPYAGRTISSVISFDPLGNPLLIMGQQPDGIYGFGVYNQMGVRVTLLSALGVAQSDAAGNPRMIAGRLPSSDYGLGVYPIGGGAVQELLPVSIGGSTGGPSYVTSGSYTPLGVSVSAVVGASGRCVVRLGAFVSTTANDQAGEVQVFIDGAIASTQLSVSASGTPIAATASAAVEQTGLTPGSHTFDVYGQSSIPGTQVIVSEITVEVQPL